jgi:hypothetical protein
VSPNRTPARFKRSVHDRRAQLTVQPREALAPSLRAS